MSTSGYVGRHRHRYTPIHWERPAPSQRLNRAELEIAAALLILSAADPDLNSISIDLQPWLRGNLGGKRIMPMVYFGVTR